MKRVLFPVLTVAVLVGALCDVGIAGAERRAACVDAADLGKGLQKAIDDAPKEGGVIELAAGCTYLVPAPEPEKGGRLGSGLVISNKALTINGNGAVLKCANRCTTLRSNDSNATIKAVTFTESAEGAIAVPFGDLTLEGVTITGNSGSVGGGMAVGTGTVTLDNTKVEYNLASGGAGIAVVIGTVKLKNHSSVSHNIAMSDGLTIGGGIFSVQGKIFIEDSVVNDNLAGNGAGVFVTMDSTVEVRGSEISGNTAFGDRTNPDFPAGGGITADRDSKVKIEGTTMVGNAPMNCNVVVREGATTAIEGCPA